MVNLVPDQELSFEAALDQLEALVGALEEGNLPLADMVERYERAMALAAYCGDLLDHAELRVRQVDVAATEAGEADEYDLETEITQLLFEEQ